MKELRGNMKKDLFIKILIEISIFILGLSLFLISNLSSPATSLDEVWNYNTANAFSMGLIPYKQVSMITTPLLPMINSVFLKVFFNGIITYRILTGITFALIVLFIFKVLKRLTTKQLIAYIFSIFIGSLFIKHFLLDYNYLFLLISLIMVFMELNAIKTGEFNNKKHNIILGILGGIAFLVKQTIGILFITVLLLEILLYVKKIGFNAKFSNIFKLICFRLLGIIIPISIFFIYLINTGAFKDFINYSIVGVKEFTNSIPYYKLFDNNDGTINIISKIMIIVYLSSFVSFILECVKNKKMTEEFINSYIIMFFAIPIIAIIYPISDEFHLMISSIYALIIIAYLISYLISFISKYININIFYKNLILIAILIINILICFKNAFIQRNLNIKNNVLSPYKHYEGVYMPEYLKDRIASVSEKIIAYDNAGVNSIIVDAESAVYDIVLNRYKKNYDMLLIGNIGENGVEKIINEIKNSHNMYYFIKNPQYSLNWQFPVSIVDYIRNNLKYHESVSVYDVYYKE